MNRLQPGRWMPTGAGTAIGKLEYQRRPEVASLPVRLAPRPVALAGREELLAELDARLAAGPGQPESNRSGSSATSQTTRGRSLGAWTGSWTGSPDNPSAASAISAMTRDIGAASACEAGEHAPHNPPVVGSSPTRPTYPRLRKRSIWPGWAACLPHGCGHGGRDDPRPSVSQSAASAARSPGWPSSNRSGPARSGGTPA